MNKKIVISIIALVVIISIVAVIGISKKNNNEFKEVAHLCNDLGGLPGVQVASPKVIDVWYFEEDDGSGKDVVICFTGENTSSKYYQYFMGSGESIDFISVGYAKDEVNTSNFIMRNGLGSSEEILTCTALMLNAMESGIKLEDNQIKQLNKLIDNGKIKEY